MSYARLNRDSAQKYLSQRGNELRSLPVDKAVITALRDKLHIHTDEPAQEFLKHVVEGATYGQLFDTIDELMGTTAIDEDGIETVTKRGRLHHNFVKQRFLESAVLDAVSDSPKPHQLREDLRRLREAEKLVPELMP